MSETMGIEELAGVCMETMEWKAAAMGMLIDQAEVELARMKEERDHINRLLGLIRNAMDQHWHPVLESWRPVMSAHARFKDDPVRFMGGPGIGIEYMKTKGWHFREVTKMIEKETR